MTMCNMVCLGQTTSLCQVKASLVGLKHDTRLRRHLAPRTSVRLPRFGHFGLVKSAGEPSESSSQPMDLQETEELQTGESFLQERTTAAAETPSNPTSTDAATVSQPASSSDDSSAKISDSWGKLEEDSGDGDWEGKPRRPSWLGNALFGVALIAAAISADYLYRRAGRQRLQARLPAPTVTISTGKQAQDSGGHVQPMNQGAQQQIQQPENKPKGDATSEAARKEKFYKSAAVPSSVSGAQDQGAADKTGSKAEEQGREMDSSANDRFREEVQEGVATKASAPSDQERIASQTQAALAHIRELQAQRLRDKSGQQSEGKAQTPEEKREHPAAGTDHTATGSTAHPSLIEDFEFESSDPEWQGEQVGAESGQQVEGAQPAANESGAGTVRDVGTAVAGYPLGAAAGDGPPLSLDGEKVDQVDEEVDLPAGMTLDELSLRAKAANKAAAAAVGAAQRAADASACAAQAAHRAAQQAQQAMAASASAQAALRLHADDAVDSAVQRAHKAQSLAEEAAKEAAVAAASGSMHEVDAAKLARRATAAAELSKPYSVVDQVTGWWRGGSRAAVSSAQRTAQGVTNLAQHTRDSTGSLVHGIRHGSADAVVRAKEASSSFANHAQHASADLVHRMQTFTGTAWQQTQQAFLYVGTVLQAWWVQLRAWMARAWAAAGQAASGFLSSLQAAWGQLVLWVQQLLRAKSG